MKRVDAEHSSIAVFISAVTISALTMGWMLWHFPIAAAATALLVVGGVAFAARVAKTLSADSRGVQDPESAA